MDDRRLAEVPVIDAPCSLRWQIQVFLHRGECPLTKCVHRGWLMDSLRGPDQVRHAGALLRVDQPVLLCAAARKRHMPLVRSILAAAVAADADLYSRHVRLLALDIGRYADFALLAWLLLFDARKPLSDIHRDRDDAVVRWHLLVDAQLLVDAPNPIAVASHTPTPTLVAAVAAHGPTEMLSWLKDHGQFGDGQLNDRLFMSAAASTGHRVNLRFLLASGCSWHSSHGFALVRHGDLDTVAWAADHGCRFDSAACEQAAAMARLDLLRFLRLRGFLTDDGGDLAVQAAESGDLELCSWVLDEGFTWTESATRALAKCDNPLSARWLLERRFPVSMAVCAIAAARGRLELLESAAAQLADWPAIRLDFLTHRNARYICPAAEEWLRKDARRVQ